MVSGFEPLFDRLVYIRHMSLVRPAIPVAVDPIKCWVAFYFTLDKENTIVYSTDQKPDYRPKMSGNVYLFVLRLVLTVAIDFDCAYFRLTLASQGINPSQRLLDLEFLVAIRCCQYNLLRSVHQMQCLLSIF